MNLRAKSARETEAATSNKETLSYTGSGKILVSVKSIIHSPKVQRQVDSVKEIAASQMVANRK
jgi:hypothetical protein